MYHLVLRNCRLHYAPGTLLSTLTSLLVQSRGFMLPRVPLVMGNHTNPKIAKAEASLTRIERTLYRLRQARVLVLRIVLAYVVVALDYVYSAMPLCLTCLRRTQTAMNGLDQGTAGATERAQSPSMDARRRQWLWLPLAVQPDVPPACAVVSQGHGSLQRTRSRERALPPSPRPLERPVWPGPGAPAAHNGHNAP